MENKNNQYYLNRKKYKLNLRVIIVLLVIILLLSYFYIHCITNLIYEHVYNNITEISEQTTTQLNLSINDQKNFVQIMVDSINRGYFETPEQIFDRFKGDLGNYHFTRLVILDKNGNGSTSDGYEVVNYQNIEEFFAYPDFVYVSENRPSTVTDNQVNIYAKTFTLKGEELVLMATINTQDYKEILLRRLFGKGGTYLINNEGSVLIDSFDVIQEDNANFYTYIKNRYKVTDQKELQKIDDMAENIKKKEIGTFDIKLGKDIYFIHYEKVDTNDWYVVTTASDSTIAKELITLIILSTILCIAINIGIIAVSLYINRRIQKQNEKLYQVAYIDPVTLLGNETYFREKGKQYLSTFGKKYALTLDINKFRALNNIYGYEFCDQILRSIGKKLQETLPSDGITCRISNDIFAAIFHYEGKIEVLLNQVIKNTSELMIHESEIAINVSVGLYKLHENEQDINQVLTKTYMARSKIKGVYSCNYYIFDELLENKLIEEQQIESCMEHALKKREFKVVYQPKTLTSTEKVVGAEALVRWTKDGAMIPPDRFIPLFEKNKFILKLDLYIFEQVCKDIKEWKKKYDFVPTVSINLSKEHFVNENFIDEYVKITNRYKIDRSQIDLEVTESATIDENIDIVNILNRIKEKGFIISIDDFGTGYSSLSMLQNMPIDIIKIDKIFLDKADLKSKNNMINYIMLLAKSLDVRTVVEGVETKEQVRFIKKLKCDIIQGYYYSKPISKEDFEIYFNEHKDEM